MAAPISSLLALGVLALGTSACQRSSSEAQSSKDAPAANTPGSELLAVGAVVPAISDTAQNGENVALRSLVGKPIVVYVYPKDDTPGCTVEAQEIRDLWSDIQATSAVVVGVSTDDADSHKAFADKHALPFLLLPDSNQDIARAFGVELKNGRATRVSFVFGRDGKLVKVFPDVNPRGHAEELLSTLKSLG